MKLLCALLISVITCMCASAQTAPAVHGEADTTLPVGDDVRPTCKLPDDDGVVIAPPDSVGSPAEDTTVYVWVDSMPVFPGGTSAWNSFVMKTMRYPDPTTCSVGCIEGTAYVRFIVEKDGAVTHVEVVKHPNSEYLKNEALRIVKSSPDWIPAKENGKIVRCSYVQPIRFSLQ